MTISSDKAGAFEIELAAVQALKKQLEDGVERNNKLRAALENQLRVDRPTHDTGPGIMLSLTFPQIISNDKATDLTNYVLKS